MGHLRIPLLKGVGDALRLWFGSRFVFIAHRQCGDDLALGFDFDAVGGSEKSQFLSHDCLGLWVYISSPAVKNPVLVGTLNVLLTKS